jgi:hypothetical protein
MIKMKSIFALLFSLAFMTVAAQPAATEVMTVGTFHFNFPNLDVSQISKTDQIDVLSPEYQNEIERIVSKIAVFKPTIIVIERQPGEQRRTDSTFNQYLNNSYQLTRREDEQIGFRLAKQLRLSKLYCVDEWGNFNERIANIVNGKDSMEAQQFEAFFETNPDASKRYIDTPVFKKEGILAALRKANEEANIKKSLGNYLVGMFKYESADRDFTGVDFETGRWFSRNLKIFRNIQRIKAGASDRILVIYGAGHLNLLNYFFDCSPEFTRVKTNDFLQ